MKTVFFLSSIVVSMLLAYELHSTVKIKNDLKITKNFVNYYYYVEQWDCGNQCLNPPSSTFNLSTTMARTVGYYYKNRNNDQVYRIVSTAQTGISTALTDQGYSQCSMPPCY